MVEAAAAMVELLKTSSSSVWAMTTIPIQEKQANEDRDNGCPPPTGPYWCPL